jgi:hypothetical protein
VTCPPQHGKGECDGHGAVIKRKARLYLLVGKWESRHPFSSNSNPSLSFSADHHIDNPVELRHFIETHNKDATGKVVTMQKQELDNATNASAIVDIKSNFEFVWNPNSTPEGKKKYLSTHLSYS